MKSFAPCLIRVLALLLLVSGPFSAHSAESYTARVYRQGSDRSELLFLHYNRVSRDSLQEHIRHYYLLPDSTLAAVDEAVLKEGEPVRLYARFLQTTEEGGIIRNGDGLVIKRGENGEYKEKEVDPVPDLISGPLFDRYIRRRWDSVSRGETLRFHLPAPSHLRLARFRLRAVDDTPYGRDGTLVLKMEPDSWFLRFLVDASYFVYDTESRRLLEIHGLTILPTQKDGDWVNTYVEMLFEYD